MICMLLNVSFIKLLLNSPCFYTILFWLNLQEAFSIKAKLQLYNKTITGVRSIKEPKWATLNKNHPLVMLQLLYQLLLLSTECESYTHHHRFTVHSHRWDSKNQKTGRDIASVGNYSIITQLNKQTGNYKVAFFFHSIGPEAVQTYDSYYMYLLPDDRHNLNLIIEEYEVSRSM